MRFLNRARPRARKTAEPGIQRSDTTQSSSRFDTHSRNVLEHEDEPKHEHDDGTHTKRPAFSRAISNAWCACAKSDCCPKADRSTQRAALAKSRSASSRSTNAFFKARSKNSPSRAKLFSAVGGMMTPAACSVSRNPCKTDHARNRAALDRSS